MKAKFVYTIFFVLSLLNPSYEILAQVTIGSSLPPRSGAMLDLKEFEGEAGGVTSSRGLGLPRVFLTDKTSLVPTVSAGNASQTEVKEQHAGLMVYNVGDEILTSEASQLCKGLHVWDAEKWVPVVSYPAHNFGQNVIRCAEGPSYTIDCNSIGVFGIYKKNVALDNSNYIEVTANFPSDYVGKEYILEAYPEIDNGVRFYAKGLITATSQTIQLAYQGTAMFSTVGPIDMVLVSNSSHPTANKCAFVLDVLLPKMRIVGVGANDYQPASQVVGSKSYVLMNNPNAFGPTANAKVKVDGFTFQSIATLSDAQWVTMFESKPDIIIRSYVATLSNNATVLAALKAYLDAGGVFLDFNDNNGTSSAGVKALYGTGANSQNVIASAVTGQIHPFENVDDEVINGPWMDLRGKGWSEDASTTQGIAGVPEDRIIIYSRSTTNGNPVVAFRDKAVKYVYVGDGGFLSGAAATSTCCYPFQLDGNNMPRSSTNDKGVMYNSHFFANLITWALKEAATNGINPY